MMACHCACVRARTVTEDISGVETVQQLCCTCMRRTCAVTVQYTAYMLWLCAVPVTVTVYSDCAMNVQSLYSDCTVTVQ